MPARRAARPSPHRFTVEQYERLSDVGILGDTDQTELVDGVIYDKVTQNEPHALALELLLAALFRRLLGRARIRSQSPLRLPPRSMPEPDVELLRLDAPRGRRPEASDLLLAVEVSDTTLAWDRRRKLPLYAAHGVPAVWIVNVRARGIDAHTGLADRRYATARTYSSGDAVPIAGFPELLVPVDEVFPR